MPISKLEEALTAIDWQKNVVDFCADIGALDAFERCNLRLAVWSRQFETADHGNPAIAFIREMQVSGHFVPALTALSFYKPAAASMRTVVESALYYTYFRDHPIELATLVRNADFFLAKKDVLEFHALHTPNFKQLQTKLGVVARLNAWYSRISAIIHGQIPGGWVRQKALKDTGHDAGMILEVANTFCEAEDIVHRLFLCTTGQSLWNDFSSPAKKALLKGLPADAKTELGLDSA